MDITALLADLRGLGLIVELNSAGKLRIDGPDHPDAARLIDRLTKHKAQVVAVLSAPSPGYSRFALSEDVFLINAPHMDIDLTDPERVEPWADKRQLAQTAKDLAAQGVVSKEVYRMATYAGYTGKEAAYVAKMVRDGDWARSS